VDLDLAPEDAWATPKGVLGQTRGVHEHMYSPGYAPNVGIPVHYHSSCSGAGSGAKGDKGNSGKRKVRESVQSVSAVDHPRGSKTSSGGGDARRGKLGLCTSGVCQIEVQGVKAKEGQKELCGWGALRGCEHVRR
jgi:hypothetical protein